MQRSRTKNILVLMAAVLALTLFLTSCAYETGGDPPVTDGGIRDEGTGGGATDGLLSIEDEPLPQSDGRSVQDAGASYDTGYDENRAYDSLLYTDDDFVYAYGKAGLYRFRHGSNAAGELIFPCEPGTIFDFVVYDDAIYFTGVIAEDRIAADGTAGQAPPAASMNIPEAALYRYDIAKAEVTLLEESMMSGYLCLRGDALYRTYIEPFRTGDMTEAWKDIDAIYQINADGTLSEVVTDLNPPEGRVYDAQNVNERLGALFSENADGTDRIRLALMVADAGYAVANEKIFYWEEDVLMVDEEEVLSKKLCAVDPDGTGAKALSEGVSNWNGLYADVDWQTARLMNYDEEHLYLTFSIKEGWQTHHKYFRMTYDGRERLDYEALAHSGAEAMGLHLADGWIYYKLPGEETLNRLRSDGSGEPQAEAFES